MADNLSQKAEKLCLAVYRVTDLFPVNEVLRSKIREKASDILLGANSLQNSDKNRKMCYSIGVEIEGLKALFNIAESQNWVKKVNLEILSQEYGNLGKEIKANHIGNKPNYATQEKKIFLPGKVLNIPEIDFGPQQPVFRSEGRCSQILEYVKLNGRVKICQVCQLFPQVSRRTLIRDLDHLSRSGLIERNGGGRGIFYQPKSEIVAV